MKKKLVAIYHHPFPRALFALGAIMLAANGFVAGIDGAGAASQLLQSAVHDGLYGRN